MNPQTAASGINDLGEIVGTYTSAPSTSASSPLIVFGFLAKPAGPEFVYVTNLNSGNVSGYTIDPTTGALTPISGSPFAAGQSPQSVAVDPTGNSPTWRMQIPTIFPGTQLTPRPVR